VTVPLSAERVAEIAARAEAATPGPWKQIKTTVGWYDRGGYCGIADVVTWEGPQHDAAFIAHAREDVPALLAELERVTDALGEIANQRPDGTASRAVQAARAALAAAGPPPTHNHRWDLWPDEPNKYCPVCHPPPAGPPPTSEDADQKASCGCYAAWNGTEWRVTASSFLCDHKQGDRLDGGPPASVPAGTEEEAQTALREARGLAAALARDLERDPRTQDAAIIARTIEGMLARSALGEDA
jgi:hypothetical protein